MALPDLLKTAAHRITTASKWEDLYEAGRAGRRHPTKWIHFSRINKIGINANPFKKTHRDPHGVYFYPVKWLLQHMNNTMWQYAVEFPYYFICDLHLDGDGVDLQDIDENSAHSVAREGDWAADYDRLQKDPSPLLNGPSGKFFSPGSNNTPDPDGFVDNDPPEAEPGQFLWAAMDYLANVEKKHSWSKMLRGVDWVHDTGGVINIQEPHQAIVLHPGCYKVIESGENKKDVLGVKRELIPALEREYGVKAVWSKKTAVLKVEHEGNPIKIIFPMDPNELGTKRMIQMEYFIDGFHQVHPIADGMMTVKEMFDAMIKNMAYWTKLNKSKGAPAAPTFDVFFIRDVMDFIIKDGRVETSGPVRHPMYKCHQGDPFNSTSLTVNQYKPDLIEVSIFSDVSFEDSGPDYKTVVHMSFTDPTKPRCGVAYEVLEKFWREFEKTVVPFKPEWMSDDILKLQPKIKVL